MSVQASAAATRNPLFRPIWRNRPVRWTVAVLLVVLLVLLTVTVFRGSVVRQRAEDPRSSTAAGAGALGRLLTDEGIAISTVDRVEDALARLDASTTLVVARPQQVSAEQARQLLARRPGRLILLRPTTVALEAFGVPATAVAARNGVFQPACTLPEAALAGPVEIDDAVAGYRSIGPAGAVCYPTGAGYGYLRAPAVSYQVEVVAGGVSNAALAREGNAAFAMDLFGSEPKLVWLMASTSGSGNGSSGGPSDRPPTLLPSWWEIAVVQAAIALVVVGIWRGRRLGPIMTESLPVTVRASETVEGHGRLYQRLTARDRAAASLRSATIRRLSRSFGSSDPLALSEVVGQRTGRTAAEVHRLLAGPEPTTDDELVALASRLDRIEGEARHG